MRLFSILISRVFDFYVWFPVVLIAAVFNCGLTINQIKILLPILLLVNVVIPTSYFFMDLAGRGITDIDVTKRQQRYHIFVRFVGICIVATTISYFFGNTKFFTLQLITLMLAVSIFTITFFYKVSGHMILNTSSVFIINYLLGWQYLWLFIVIPLVAFARIYLKKHNFAQIALGTAVGLVEPYLILRMFNLM